MKKKTGFWIELTVLVVAAIVIVIFLYSKKAEEKIAESTFTNLPMGLSVDPRHLIEKDGSYVGFADLDHIHSDEDLYQYALSNGLPMVCDGCFLQGEDVFEKFVQDAEVGKASFVRVFVRHNLSMFPDERGYVLVDLFFYDGKYYDAVLDVYPDGSRIQFYWNGYDHLLKLEGRTDQNAYGYLIYVLSNDLALDYQTISDQVYEDMLRANEERSYLFTLNTNLNGMPRVTEIWLAGKNLLDEQGIYHGFENEPEVIDDTYALEHAIVIQNYQVPEKENAVFNQELMDAFYANAQEKIPGMVSIYEAYMGDRIDLIYDGTHFYVISDKSYWIGVYDYVLRWEVNQPGNPRVQQYVLSNTPDVTYEQYHYGGNKDWVFYGVFSAGEE
ncbi:MAG: hypothetical protein IJ744_09930 [Lachnospiraceae bacterium]|nr:hypothetical protein [Lachnospiraceae bacterium]